MANQEEKEHVAFRRWLRSLSRSQLLNAMEFSFILDEDSPQSGVGGSTSSVVGSSNSSHEYDLLVEMVKLQSPPPTPIHPRAVEYQPATGRGKTDGRHEGARILRNRTKRPRYFRFFQRQSYAGVNVGNNPHLAALLASLPPSSSNNTTAPSRRRGGGGSNKKRNGNSNRACNSTMKVTQRYEIFARNFFCGDGLDLGCTEEERAADKFLLTYSVIDKCDNFNPNDNNAINPTGSGGNPYMSFCATSQIKTVADILRILKVASRGRFLSQSHYRDSNENNSDQNNNTPPFCAPWLEPADPQKLFSLPMYLVSRFEVALWHSYTNEKRVHPLTKSRPWDNLSAKLDEAVIEQTIQRALRSTLLRNLIPTEKVIRPATIRDRLLFDLLDADDFWRFKQCQLFTGSMTSANTKLLSTEVFLMSISRTPIQELGSTTDQLRVCVQQNLQSEISAQIGKDLLAAVASSSPESNGIATPQRPAGTASRNNRKKKQRKKTASRRRQTEPQSSSASTTEKGDDQKNDKGVSIDKHDGEEMDNNSQSTANNNNLAPTSEMRVSFPDNGTPFVERNRNIVLCLSTLNDIVNEVFNRVGLEVSSDESDSVPTGRQGRVATKKRRENEPTKTAAVTSASRCVRGSSAQQKEQRQRNTPNSSRQSRSNTKQEVTSSDENKACLPDEGGVPLVLLDGSVGAASALSPNNPAGAGVDSDTFPSQYCFPPGFFLRTAPFASNPWGVYQRATNEDGWGESQCLPPREHSILAEFFLEQELSDANRLERVTASSTAASLASSTDKNNEETMSISDKFFISLDNGDEAPASDIASDIGSTEISMEEFPSLDIYHEEESGPLETAEDSADPSHSSATAELKSEKPESAEPTGQTDTIEINARSSSISPEAPATPSPRLSPILLSLDDLRDIREGVKVGEKSAQMTEKLPPGVTLTVPSSLPSSPVEQSKRRLVASLSREDLRVINSFRDDQNFARDRRRRSMNHAAEGSPSYRNVATGAAKVLTKRTVSSDGFLKSTSKFAIPRKTGQPGEVCARSETGADMRDESQNSGSGPPSYRNVAAKSVKSASGGSWNPVRLSAEARFTSLSKHQVQREQCARSETAVEGHEEYQNWNDSRRSLQENADNITVGKDGSTTITSALSQRETEETSNLKEECNTFRDMCLTLGAEVARLKNQLAAHQGAAVYPAYDYTSQGYVQQLYGAASFDPECMPPFFQNGQTIGAMSDAGVHRGEYESQMSEDEDRYGKITYTDSGRRLSSGNTIAGSDVSIEPTNSSLALQGPAGLPLPVGRDSQEAVSSGLKTRLADDILRFVAATDMQHRKLDRTRDAAVERMTRLVNTLWPRAQVKVYGSHVTGLCLPSSDLDFIICLPAVHKNTPALAPGALEGRNAINETSQKLLARKLKGESWIDPRSMKLIERTVVPVIKVATKDTRARTVQLDISFDSAEHHGLEAVMMVKQIMEELPVLRPLVLVLKQFLLDRALLTAYTGGLSSYCLFLMVARYLQEQSSWLDCGSLLMGFLDFYGNCFDPRSTGISVGRRQYFTRPNYVPANRQVAGQHMWPGVSVIPSPATAVAPPDFYRRNSFSDKGNTDGLRGATAGRSPSPLMRNPRFQNGTRFYSHLPQPAEHAPMEAVDHAMPFAFDPLFVDDPLSYGNNVGRNAFRIFQVQRAFSDAHRALVASLEWDIAEGDLHDGNDYPLLKCLLQSEDVLYEL